MDALAEGGAVDASEKGNGRERPSISSSSSSFSSSYIRYAKSAPLQFHEVTLGNDGGVGGGDVVEVIGIKFGFVFGVDVLTEFVFLPEIDVVAVKRSEEVGVGSKERNANARIAIAIARAPLELEVTPGNDGGGVGGGDVVEVIGIKFGLAFGVDIRVENVLILKIDILVVVRIVELGSGEEIGEISTIVATTIGRSTFIKLLDGDFLGSRDWVGESESR